MASAFSHALVAITMGKTYSKRFTTWKFWLLGSICAIVPDADVVSFKLGIPYEHLFGHRGFTHSILFSFLLALVVTKVFYKNTKLLSTKGLLYILFFFLCTASHAVLDAMTTGGLGVAFFAPFDNTRYFFPWRPIQVSPIGIDSFLSEWGIRVIKSEFIWVGIPCFIYMTFVGLWRRIRSRRVGKSNSIPHQ